MRNVYVVLAATAVALGAATAPAFAHDSQSLRSVLVDGGHDVAVAVAGGTLTEARIVSSVPAAFEKRARIGGVAVSNRSLATRRVPVPGRRRA